MNIDQGKLAQIQEVMGWLQQAQKHYRWLQYQIADDCIKKARAALTDPIFDRQPIPGMGRELPETIKIVSNNNSLGYAIINVVDFDPSVHQLWEEPTPPVTTKRSKSS